MKLRSPLRRSQALGATLFLALTLGLGLLFLRCFAPPPPLPHMPPFTGFNPAPMDEAMRAPDVRRELETILGFGSRYLGQPGFTRTRDHIRQRFAAAGLQVLEYPQQTAAPVTSDRRILAAGGAPLADTEIYPFMPNHFQPIVTPAAGLSGELLLVDDDVLLNRRSFTNCLAVVDVARLPLRYGCNWIRYAEVGFKAVILAHREGLAAVPWPEVAAPMVSSVPVNYPRLAATEGVFDHLGETVTLHVRVDWRNVDNTTVIGYFPAATDSPRREAILVSSCYDAPSILPDLAPNPMAALGVAVQLSLLEGLQTVRDQTKRDVLFISCPTLTMANLPADRIAALLGSPQTTGDVWRRLRTEDAENARRLAHTEAALTTLAVPGFLTDAEPTAAAIARLPPPARAFFEEQARYVLSSIMFEFAEEPLRTRLAFLARNPDDLTTPEFLAYRAAKARYDAATAAAGFSLPKLVAQQPDFVRDCRLAERCAARVRELHDHHVWRAGQLRSGLAVHARLTRYERLIGFSAALAPADAASRKGEAISFVAGGMQNLAVNDLLQTLHQQPATPATLRFDALRTTGHDGWVSTRINGIPLDSSAWSQKGRPAFAVVNSDRTDAYRRFGDPAEQPYMRDLDTVRDSLHFTGRLALALAFGDGRFEPPRQPRLTGIGGRVLAANVGRSIVPNYPMKHALVGHKGPSGSFAGPGNFRTFFLFTDPYGHYDVPLSSATFVPFGAGGYSPEAAWFAPDGVIAWIKDEGPQGQSVHASMNLGWAANRADVSLVVFRADPVTVLDTINPQSLGAFTDTGFISRDGLAPLLRRNLFSKADGIVTAFLEPDQRFFLTLKAGAPDNPLVQMVRAFALNVPAGFRGRPGREIDGLGFLPADTPLILDVPGHIARSMLQVNEQRLTLQTRHRMADEQTQTFMQRARERLAQAGVPNLSEQESLNRRRESATYAILSHPILRQSIREAILGILWYLGLLVPFVFFFEKLVFGYADIRRQLAAQAGIFLTVFGLLWLLHPAFQMIRSSLMILLGFIVMLVSGGVNVLLAGKFRENLEQLGKQRGQVNAAEVNRSGVLATAFALGLNNMHRRIVRTGLTCATLVLLTFAMICFTTSQSQVVNDARAVGKAAYQGFLVKRERLYPIQPAELFALQSKYGHAHRVSPRRMLVGLRDFKTETRLNPEFDVTYEPTNGIARKLPVASVLTFAAEEPLQHRLALLTSRGWLPKEEPGTRRADAPWPVLIPDGLAEALHLSPEAVNRGDVALTLGDMRVTVHGIFQAASLAALRDLDDRDLLPFDVQAVQTVQAIDQWRLLAEDDDPRLDADRIVIAPEGFNLLAANSELRLVSVAVHMPDLPYREARPEIERYLEQSGQATYYGLGDTAYRGRRARARTLEGLIEILIPLIIAALTVLNTVRGSVYERREEIFVYNAVGIAPRYIFAMFFSEAFVYAVVGSVLGYILSQGTGLLLTRLGLTGDLNMTFTSAATIYASLAVMGAVFLSTLFPARVAMRIAAPADDAGWRLPEPEGDDMRFVLPFTFNHHDRVAVIAFFRRYLLDQGEGSSGPFFAGHPAPRLTPEADTPDRAIPALACTVWLKPFDLGVAQELVIALPADPKTGEYVAELTLTRISGTREAWLKLNRPFVTLLRRNFLYWRAVSLSERAALFEEARQLLAGPRAEGTADRGTPTMAVAGEG